MLISGEMTTAGSQASRANIDALSRPNNLNGLDATNEREPAVNRESGSERPAPRLSRDEGSTLTVSDEARALSDSASQAADEASTSDAIAANAGASNQQQNPLQSSGQANTSGVVQENAEALSTFSQIASFGDDEQQNVSFSAFA